MDAATNHLAMHPGNQNVDAKEQIDRGAFAETLTIGKRPNAIVPIPRPSKYSKGPRKEWSAP